MGVRNLVKVCNLGRFAYRPSLLVQKYFEKQHLERGNEGDNVLILVEHDPVYTLGMRQQVHPDEVKRLMSIGADVVHADRGGLTTFHGPGQLVAYPIFNLTRFGGMPLRNYVWKLENVAIHACRNLGIAAEQDTTSVSHTGAWVNGNKICAIGVHQKQSITTHGLALNCNVDLKWYRHIVPCGITDRGITTISKELGQDHTVENVIPQFLTSFDAIFNVEVTPLDSNIVEKVKTLSPDSDCLDAARQTV